ncbi:MAG: DinB family protein [Chloroflexi bacterium]|nr:DinB family protein [Chloroflexota bacterium]
MAEQSVTALTADLSKAGDEYMAELRQAGLHWDHKPAGGEGEDAWCARQVAEHVAGAQGFFGHGISQHCGFAGPGRTGGEFATADQAIAATPEAIGKLVGVVQQVPEAKLADELEFGPLGKTTMAQVLGVTAYHMRDHANQLKALREG